MIDVHVEYPAETGVKGGSGFMLLDWITSISLPSVLGGKK